MPKSRQLAAIVFIDIVGYSALMETDEGEAFQQLAQFKNKAAPLVEHNQGEWVKDLGDGALCSFGSTLSAVKCAMDIQHQLNRQLTAKVRIGIHLGDITFQDGDVFGDGVNVASRIQGEAAPGGICISEAVYRTIKNKDGIDTAFIGTRKLKNIANRLKLYQVTNPGIETRRKSQGLVIPVWQSILITVAATILTAWLVHVLSSPVISDSTRVERYDIILPMETPLAFIGSAHLGAGTTALALSPNGNLLVYAGQDGNTTRLFIRYMDNDQVVAIPGTDGAYSPFFSPDGNWIAFFSQEYLKKVSINGGTPILLTEVANPNGAVWTQNNGILIADNEGTNLLSIDEQGGEVYPVKAKGTEIYYNFNYPSPLGAKHILTSEYHRGINVISIESGELISILDHGRNPHYLPSGHLSFIEYGRLMIVPFDIRNMTLTGTSISIIDDLRTESSSGQFAISNDGDLIYAPGGSSVESELILRSSDGQEQLIPLKSDYYGQIKISPDGEKLLIFREDNNDLYVYDMPTQSITRITNDGKAQPSSIWGPSSQDVTYGTRDGIFRVNITRSEEPVQIVNSAGGLEPYSWSPDGNVLMYYESQSSDVKFHFITDPGKHLTLMPNQKVQVFGSFSPGGDYIVYASDESGRYEIYAQPFPPDGTRWTISSQGGEEPLWSPDGDKIYYRYGNSWYQVQIQTTPKFIILNRRELFTGSYINVPGYSYDVTPDGTDILLLRPVNNAETTTRLKVVKNWFNEVQRLAPSE